jgi:tRNA A37 N6-isopentenylltransferase MiaA
MHPIVTGLLKFVRRIGKWLADYLEERTVVFRDRLARVVKRTTAVAKRRAVWLRGRISRWLAAAKWLRENAAGVDDKAIEMARKLPAIAKLPISAPEESEPAAA